MLSVPSTSGNPRDQGIAGDISICSGGEGVGVGEVGDKVSLNPSQVPSRLTDASTVTGQRCHQGQEQK